MSAVTLSDGDATIHIIICYVVFLCAAVLIVIAFTGVLMFQSASMLPDHLLVDNRDTRPLLDTQARCMVPNRILLRD